MKQNNLDYKDELISSLEHLIEIMPSFHDITVSKLTKHAGIARSRFYNYFDDKNALLKACFVKVQADVEAHDSAWCLINRESSLVDLQRVIHGITKAYHRHKHLLIAIRDISITDVKTHQIMDSMVRRRINRLSGHITAAQDQGWVLDSLLSEETATWIVSTGFRTYEQTVATGDCELDDFVNQYSKYIWKILYAAD